MITVYIKKYLFTCPLCAHLIITDNPPIDPKIPELKLCPECNKSSLCAYLGTSETWKPAEEISIVGNVVGYFL